MFAESLRGNENVFRDLFSFLIQQPFKDDTHKSPQMALQDCTEQ